MRQRITAGDKKDVIEKEQGKVTLADYGLGPSSADVNVKDLGPQICGFLYISFDF